MFRTTVKTLSWTMHIYTTSLKEDVYLTECGAVTGSVERRPIYEEMNLYPCGLDIVNAYR
jgi:hypothetical protein